MFFLDCCMSREKPYPQETEQDFKINFRNFFRGSKGSQSIQECQDVYGECQNLFGNNIFYAMLDGHGPFGQEAAAMVVKTMFSHLYDIQQKVMRANTDQKRQDILRQLHFVAEKTLRNSNIDCRKSGVCGVTAIIFNTNLYLANVGDSRLVLFRKTGEEKQVIQLSTDHRVSNKIEETRILKSGGYIEAMKVEGQSIGPHRVWKNKDGPGFVCTRTLGDFAYEGLLISDPEFNKIRLTKDDKLLIFATDGVWDVMSNEEACEFFDKEQSKQELGELFLEECRKRWEFKNQNQDGFISDSPSQSVGCDDLSVYVIFLHPEVQ